MSDTPADNNPAHCADVVRRLDFLRHATALFAPSEHRAALLSLYAFNAEISRIYLNVRQPMAGEIRLQWWDDVLAGERRGEASGHPVASALLATIESHRLSPAGLRDLITAHRFDLYIEPMQTQAEMEGYLDQTNGWLFALSARVLGERSSLLQALAHHAALATGILELIAALPHHAARKQLYLPADLLRRGGVDVEQVFAGKPSDELRAVVRSLAERADSHWSESMKLLPDMKSFARAAFLPLAMVPRRLRQLQKAGHDPFALTAPSNFATLWTLWRASRAFQSL